MQNWTVTKHPTYSEGDILQPIQKRWEDAWRKLDPAYRKVLTHALQDAIKRFKNNYPTYQQFTDLHLVETIYVPMNDIYINAPLQRELDVNWVVKLLLNFSETKIMPLSVYRYSNKRMVAWEGQHTLALLWLIATIIFKDNVNQLKVPVNIYQIVYAEEIIKKE